MSASGLTFPLGPGAVGLRSDGTIEGVRPNPGRRPATSTAAGGCRTAREIKRGDDPPRTPETRLVLTVVAATVAPTWTRWSSLPRSRRPRADRPPFLHRPAGPFGCVRQPHPPAAGLGAELAWVPAATSPARALAAGATGAYAIPGPDGAGALLGGELVLGTCDAISRRGSVLVGSPWVRSGGRWRSGAGTGSTGPASFGRKRVASRATGPGPAGQRVVAADDGRRVHARWCAPGRRTQARRGPHLGLLVFPAGPQQVSVEVRSRRGVTAYGMEWVGPLDEVLASIGEPLLTGPRTRAGVAGWAMWMPLWSSSTCWCGAGGQPGRGRRRAGPVRGPRRRMRSPMDGAGVCLLCGEFERTWVRVTCWNGRPARSGGWSDRCRASAWPPPRSAWRGCRWAGRLNRCSPTSDGSRRAASRAMISDRSRCPRAAADGRPTAPATS